jgi:hypothetical protein
MVSEGRPLNPLERALCMPFFRAETLGKARIIEGKVPFWLSYRMRAVVLGHKIYFRQGAYLQGSQLTLGDVCLLAHELTHVEQYLSGMTVIKYLWASRHGYRQNPYEIEAYAKGHYIATQIDDKLKFAIQIA